MHALSFAPVSERIGNFLVVGTPGKAEDSSSMKNTSKKKKIIMSYYKEYSQYLEDINPLYNASLAQQNESQKIDIQKEKVALYPSPKSQTVKTIKKDQLYPLIFLNRKLKRLNFKKLKKIKEMTEEVLNELKSFENLLVTFITNNVPITVDADSIKKVYDEYLYSNPSIKQMNFKMLSIQTKISFLKQKVKKKKVKYTRPFILDCLRLSSILPSHRLKEEKKQNPDPEIDIQKEDLRFEENAKMGYREYCQFDDILESIIPTQIFDGIANQINQGNFNAFNEYFELLCEMLHLQPVKQGTAHYELINMMLITLKSALSRIIFGRFYLLSPVLDIYSHKITENSAQLVQFTPRQFSIVNNLFKDQTLYDIPIQDLFAPEILLESEETAVISSTCTYIESMSLMSTDSDISPNSSLSGKKRHSSIQSNQPSSILAPSLIQNSFNNGNDLSNSMMDDESPIMSLESKGQAYSDDNDGFVISLRYDDTDSSSSSVYDDAQSKATKKSFDTSDLDSEHELYLIIETLHPFGDIAQPEIVALLESAFQLINRLPFYTDPFDITNTLSLFLREITKIIMEVEKNTKFNFDDFFALYVIFFAQFLPENSRGISAFLNLITNARLQKMQERRQTKKLITKSQKNAFLAIENSFPAEYSHALSIFNAALDYLNQFKPEDLQPQ